MTDEIKQQVKNRRFDMRISPQERQLIHKLADRLNVSSSEAVLRAVEIVARKEGVANEKQ